MKRPEDFNVLSEGEQHSAILNGAFLSDREENGLIMQLYSLSSFYSELQYDPTANKIVRRRAFKGTQKLGPYLVHIRFNARQLGK